MKNEGIEEKDVLKQLTRIANSLEKIEKKIPDASHIRFGENLLGGLYIGYEREQCAKALCESEEVLDNDDRYNK